MYKKSRRPFGNSSIAQVLSHHNHMQPPITLWVDREFAHSIIIKTPTIHREITNEEYKYNPIHDVSHYHRELYIYKVKI